MKSFSRYINEGFEYDQDPVFGINKPRYDDKGFGDGASGSENDTVSKYTRFEIDNTLYYIEIAIFSYNVGGVKHVMIVPSFMQLSGVENFNKDKDKIVINAFEIFTRVLNIVFYFLDADEYANGVTLLSFEPATIELEKLYARIPREKSITYQLSKRGFVYREDESENITFLKKNP